MNLLSLILIFAGFGSGAYAGPQRIGATAEDVAQCKQGLKALWIEEDEFASLDYGNCDYKSTCDLVACAVDYKETLGALPKRALSSCSRSTILRSQAEREKIFGCATDIATRLKIDVLDRDDRDNALKLDEPSIGENLVRVCVGRENRTAKDAIITCVQEASKTKARMSYLLLSCRDPVVRRRSKDFQSCVSVYVGSIGDAMKGDKAYFDPHCSNDREWKTAPQVQKCVTYFQKYIDSRNFDLSKTRAAEALQSCLSEPTLTKYAEVRACIDGITKLGAASEEDFWDTIKFCRTSEGLEKFKDVSECLSGRAFPTGVLSEAIKRCVNESL
jgi:hypothetical protein